MVTRVFYDTEFIDNGSTIDLISLGAVDEQGREFYAVSTEFNPATASQWVRDNVLDKLPPRSDPAWMPRHEIRDRYFRWLTEPGDKIELWAYFAAYDHVAYAQLWGAMINLPKVLPMRTNDLMTLWDLAGRPEKPPQPENQHDALADARWNRDFYNRCALPQRFLINTTPLTPEQIEDLTARFAAAGAPGSVMPLLRGEPGLEVVDLPAGQTVHDSHAVRELATGDEQHGGGQ